tara:strand:- start:755 stop:1018 length:264 start_codon:yes stop_codon:yes gene_type:complete
MMRKLKIILDVAGLFVVWGLVFFTAGMMFEGIADYGLYDVLKACAIIFGFGGVCTMFVFNHITDFVYLKSKDDKPESKELEEIHDNI